MEMDERIEPDLRAYARATAYEPRALDDLAAAVRAAGAAGLLSRIQRPILAGALTLAVVLVAPVPYSRQRGFDINITPDGTVVRTPHLERVWGTVYAMAKEKLFHIDLELKDQTSEELEGEIRKQLAAEGYTVDEVKVWRWAGLGAGTHCDLLPPTTRVTIDAHRGPQPLHLSTDIDTAPGPARLVVRDGQVISAPRLSPKQEQQRMLERLKACGFKGQIILDDNGGVRIFGTH
jgi:hypothetical protein